jgi:imidazolonepropionase-like amidohydrolase
MIAIRAATYGPSVVMRVSDQVGTVSVGKYSDVIAVRGDVLRYIELLLNVDLVIKHGRRTNQEIPNG